MVVEEQKYMLNQIKTEFNKQIDQCRSLEELEKIRISFLGRKEKLSLVLKGLKDLPEDERKKAGQDANKIKQDIEMRLGGKMRELESVETAKKLKNEQIDITQPVIGGRELGNLHPLTQTQNEIEDIFASMGFMILDGPELESEYYNFEALNIPSWHPAREMQDTFYVKSQKSVKSKVSKTEDNNRLLMRTHTSTMQVRAMLKYGAPIRAIVSGRCFRNEATDVRHEHTFDQFEGFVVGEDISISNLIAVLEVFAKALFGEDTKIRMRPKYYPFVEPGSNGEITCSICHGKGCRLCKYTGWLEIFGCGLIHPNVLKAGNINLEKYSGFAFGFGLTRVVQLKHRIEDVRLFNSGDLRFLKQF